MGNGHLASVAGQGAGPAVNLQILARGINNGPVNNEGAEITYYDTPGGGFVFSVGSLTFGGSLVVDGQLQAIVRNVLDECLASNRPRMVEVLARSARHRARVDAHSQRIR